MQSSARIPVGMHIEALAPPKPAGINSTNWTWFGSRQTSVPPQQPDLSAHIDLMIDRSLAQDKGRFLSCSGRVTRLSIDTIHRRARPRVWKWSLRKKECLSLFCAPAFSLSLSLARRRMRSLFTCTMIKSVLGGMRREHVDTITRIYLCRWLC